MNPTILEIMPHHTESRDRKPEQEVIKVHNYDFNIFQPFLFTT